jgi:hypothetical protein
MALGQGHDGGVDDPEGKVPVLFDQVGDPFPFRVQDGLDEQLAMSSSPSATERQNACSALAPRRSARR